MRTLKRPEQPPDPYKAQPLPITRPIAVYYRQSSEAQVGNISTTLQTVDMVEHLEKLGWIRERIRMVDLDRGISGTKGIKERPGMSTIFDLIEHGEIGAVASQDVDRFFREMAQIETNIFIEACRYHKVLVLTPTFIYDFAHPTQGRFHIQMFREQVQRAADYLEFHIRGRLVKARHYRTERGFYTGRKIAPGFMVDMREKLPDGMRNPHYQKYVRFDRWADVTLAYFELFQANEGNLDKTWRQIEVQGPGFPNVTEDMIPEGFLWRKYVHHYSPVTGQLVPSVYGLKYLLTNVAYIGHWIHKQVIVGWNNHEAIIPLELFMYAYNRLSPTDFQGDPNPHYVPYRPWVRHDKAERQVEPPTYSYLIYTDDLPHQPHKMLGSSWDSYREEYKYILSDNPHKSNVWNIKTRIVDGIVDRLLLERLKATTVDEAAWQEALASLNMGDDAEIRRIETAIRAAKQTKENLIASLATLTNPEMVQHAQARYETATGEIAMLTAELEAAQAKSRHSLAVLQARPALEKVIANWERVPRAEKRALFEGFATHIHITKLSRASKRLTIHWRDGSQSPYTAVRENQGYFWEQDQLDKLRQMIDNNVDQVDILRAFPTSTWRSLQDRYAYNFGNGHRPLHYTGHRPYSNKTCWADTKEAKLGLSSKLAPSGSSTDRREEPFFCACGRSSPPRSGSPAARDGASGGKPRLRR
jgi:DNA invertase Pin-like site-specific DNA recombinase